MNCTTLATQTAHVAVAARPCGVVGRRCRWHAVTLEVSARFGLMPENSVIKRTARRLGLLTT